MSTPVVPVLLPVRLETRFDRPTTGRPTWRLRLRVVPDDALIDRFDPLASQEELDLVERLWQAGAGDLDGEAGRAAWAELVSQVSGARAAWLIRLYPFGAPRPARERKEAWFGGPRGLPDQLEVWLGRGGAPPQLATTLSVLPAAKAPLDLDTGQRSWWNSYKEAEQAGLATAIDLGTRADDIDVLLVTGLSAEKTTDWYVHQCEHGHVGLLAPGTPTNTVEGGPAAPLDGDPAHWLAVARGQGASDAGAEAVAVALTGDQQAARPLLGGATEVESVAGWLVQGLWHALWGHPIKDLFGIGADTHQGGLWAATALRPEGPLPTLRIGTQPYGLLPVTALDRWTAAPGDPPFEADALDSLRRARDLWAAAGEQAGTVAGADTDALLSLLSRTPSSDAYAWRWFVSLDLLHLLWSMFGAAPQWPDLLNAYLDGLRVADNVCPELDPRIPLAAFGWPVDLDIPLVQPRNFTEQEFRDLLVRMSEPRFNVAAIFSEGGWRLLPGGERPEGLLPLLLMYAHWVAAAEVAREQQNRPGPSAPPWGWPQGTREPLHADAAAMQQASQGGPAFQLRSMLQKACGELSRLPLDEIERAMRAVLDTASHRLDPWLTGYALRRLRTQAAGWTRVHGVYGWVDAPRPGAPGPTAGGLLHTPSHAQAYTAMVLRDRAVSDPEAGRWDMDLDSAMVRAADRLGAGVRAGGHLAEVLGAEVERVVGDPGRVDDLRGRFPIRTEHAGRRVCDGVAVLAADPPTLGLPAAVLAALGELRAAVDAYGDLLVAQAVHHVVGGRGEIAGAAMDAAAGLAVPPTLEVLHTPRTGRTAATTAVLCLPNVPPPAATLDTGPARVADPAFAAFVENVTGPADDFPWSWEADLPSGGQVRVSLADLALAPCDTAVLPEDTMAFLVGAALGSEATVRPESPGFAAHRRARSLVVVAGNEPAEPGHLVTSTRPDPAPVAAELRTRLATLEAQAVAVRDAILAAVGGTPSAQATALHRALLWGVTSIAEAQIDLDARIAGAAAALTGRIGALPAAPERAGLSPAQLARHIAELAAADGRWPVLSRIDLSALPTGLAAASDVNGEWLPVMSAVRPPLARLEAFQLDTLVADGASALATWTNRPGDVWQRQGVRDPETGRLPDSHLLAAFAPPGSLTGVQAVGLLDQWSEVIPETEHPTTAGFGFNAPAARAPQAILLAVPPAADGLLQPGDLAAIVLEARRLARVRTVRTTDLGDVSAVAPTTLLPAAPPAGVEL